MDLSYEQKKEATKLGDEELQKTLKRYEEVVRQETVATVVPYQGFWFPPSAHLKGVMVMQDHFRPRADDIILATFPKCVTTWIRALVFAIMNRFTYDFDSHPLLEKTPQELIPFTDSLGGEESSYLPLETSLLPPRYVCTHMPCTLFPDRVKNSSCKFVYVIRDPKDAFVSKWHFLNNWRPISNGKRWSPEDYPLEYVFQNFCIGISSFGSFWDHALSYWKASQERPDRVLFLTYQDLKTNTAAQVKRMAQFLGVPFTVDEEEREDVVEQIVKLCSFENLSNLEVNKISTNTGKEFQNSFLFRKGVTGDGKNFLDPAMVAQMDKITMEKFAGSALEMLKL